MAFYVKYKIYIIFNTNLLSINMTYDVSSLMYFSFSYKMISNYVVFPFSTKPSVYRDDKFASIFIKVLTIDFKSMLSQILDHFGI